MDYVERTLDRYLISLVKCLLVPIALFKDITFSVCVFIWYHLFRDKFCVLKGNGTHFLNIVNIILLCYY